MSNSSGSGNSTSYQVVLFSFFIIVFSIRCNWVAHDKSLPSQPNILFMIADDWSYPHAGVYGDGVVRTPTFDKLATSGVLFSNAYCASPSCAPSRAAILTGRYPHQLESAGNLWSVIPQKFDNWVSILSDAGYHTGKIRKGWGPGDYSRGGYLHNPAGPDFESFESFLDDRSEREPFCFWFGSSDPHRVYQPNTGAISGMSLDEVNVPAFLPDRQCVRNDILDYYFEVERFDRECGQLLKLLEERGELQNTIVVMTSDNGMPFPRAKANLYDFGTRMPLVVSWPAAILKNHKVESFVNFVDLGPTILEAAGKPTPRSFSGNSFLPLLLNQQESQKAREMVFLERERHANVRKGDLSYPMRAIRTRDHLLIKNFENDRWPGGDPEVHQSVGQFGDVDNSISKFLILEGKDRPETAHFFNWSFGKRPELELYNVKDDPFNLTNLAEDPQMDSVKNALIESLESWMYKTGDLRYSEPQTIYWDTVVYTPNYQHEEFDLDAEIAAYQMNKRMPNGRMVIQGCL